MGNRMIGHRTTQAELDALRDEGKPRAGLRYLVSEEMEDEESTVEQLEERP